MLIVNSRVFLTVCPVVHSNGNTWRYKGGGKRSIDDDQHLKNFEFRGISGTRLSKCVNKLNTMQCLLLILCIIRMIVTSQTIDEERSKNSKLPLLQILSFSYRYHNLR